MQNQANSPPRNIKNLPAMSENRSQTASLHLEDVEIWIPWDHDCKILFDLGTDGVRSGDGGAGNGSHPVISPTRSLSIYIWRIMIEVTFTMYLQDICLLTHSTASHLHRK